MKILSLLMIPFIAITFVSCDDEKEGCMDPISLNYDEKAEKDNGTCQYAGPNGTTEIVFFPKQGSVNITSTSSYQDTAYLKWNTTEFPGINPANYDVVKAGDVSENHIHFLNMKTGKYYIYMTGWNHITNKRVSGGTTVTVTQSSGTINYDVQMTD